MVAQHIELVPSFFPVLLRPFQDADKALAAMEGVTSLPDGCALDYEAAQLRRTTGCTPTTNIEPMENSKS